MAIGTTGRWTTGDGPTTGDSYLGSSVGHPVAICTWLT